MPFTFRLLVGGHYLFQSGSKLALCHSFKDSATTWVPFRAGDTSYTGLKAQAFAPRLLGNAKVFARLVKFNVATSKKVS